MRSLIRLMTSSGAWRNSPYSDLPEVSRGDTELTRHYLVIAGGLALILSRATAPELGAGLQATQELHEHLRRELRLGIVDADPALLGEVMHEIDELADPRTKVSLRHCYDVQVQRALRRKRRAPRHAAAPSSMMSTRSSQRPGNPQLDAPTVVSSDLFDQRSQVLRKSVREARSTAATQPPSQL